MLMPSQHSSPRKATADLHWQLTSSDTASKLNLRAKVMPKRGSAVYRRSSENASKSDGESPPHPRRLPITNRENSTNCRRYLDFTCTGRRALPPRRRIGIRPRRRAFTAAFQCATMRPRAAASLSARRPRSGIVTSAPTADDSAARALVFGGYRWRNDIAVEASFSSIDQYALRPDTAGGRKGVGFNFGSNSGLGELATRSWNVDVFTSWTFYRSLALYGRVGYGQSETVPAFGTIAGLRRQPAPARWRERRRRACATT